MLEFRKTMNRNILVWKFSLLVTLDLEPSTFWSEVLHRTELKAEDKKDFGQKVCNVYFQKIFAPNFFILAAESVDG